MNSSHQWFDDMFLRVRPMQGVANVLNGHPVCIVQRMAVLVDCNSSR